jgi:hypothetical protein
MFLRINTQCLMYDWDEPLKLIDDLVSSYDATSVLKDMPVDQESLA